MDKLNVESIVMWAGSYFLIGMWNRALRGLPLSSPDRYRAGFVTGNRYLDRSGAGFVTLNKHQDRSRAGFVTWNRYQGRCRGQGRCGGRIGDVARDAAVLLRLARPGRQHYYILEIKARQRRAKSNTTRLQL